MSKFNLLNRGRYTFSGRVKFPVVVEGTLTDTGSLRVSGKELLRIGGYFFKLGSYYRFNKGSYTRRLVTMRNK